jgi:hypothetical protein
MNTAGAHELGYASAAIVGALLDRLVINKVISRGDAAAILDDATTALKGLGNLASVPGAVRVVGDVSAHLASETRHALVRACHRQAAGAAAQALTYLTPSMFQECEPTPSTAA